MWLSKYCVIRSDRSYIAQVPDEEYAVIAVNYSHLQAIWVIIMTPYEACGHRGNGAGVLASQQSMKRVNSRSAENDSELSAEMY